MAQSTTETPRKRGRPRKNLVQMPPAETQKTAAIADQTPPTTAEPASSAETGPLEPSRPIKTSTHAFPVPPKPGKGGFCRDQEGIAYWRLVGNDPQFRERVAAYVNREHPILNHLQELSEEERAEISARRKRGPFKYIDKPQEPFNDDVRMEILHRYGSGTYKIYVNDIGVSGHRKDPAHPELGNRNVCKFVLSFWDSDFPPVLDPSRPDKGMGILDVNHPQNQSYIGELRQRGIMPPTPRTGEDDMSNAVVEKLIDRVEGLTEKVNEGKQAATLAEIKERLDSKGGDLTTQILLALINRPQTDTAGPIVQMFQTQMQQMNEANRTQIGLLTDALKEERTARRELENSVKDREPPDPFAWFERMTTTMAKAKDIFGGNGAAAGPGVVGTAVKHVSKMNGTLEFLAEVLPKIAEAPILTAIANRMMQGAAAAPAGFAPAAAPGTNPAGSTAELLRFVQDITPAMLNYLEDTEVDGEDFATWVHAGYPARLAELQAHGPEVIIATYRNSPTWARIAPIAARFDQFVREFCTFTPEPKQNAQTIEVNGAAPPDIDFDAPLEGNPIV